MAVDSPGASEVPPTERAAVRIPGTPEGLRQASQAFEHFRLRCGIATDAAWQMGLALDEVLSNSIGHGLSGRPDGYVEAVFTWSDDTLEVTVLDDGPAFNPLSLPAPDTASALDARRPGGLGVHFVRNLMDRVSYQRQGERNRFVFARRLPAGESASTGPDAPASPRP